MVNVKPGDIVFYRPTGFIGWAISKITKSEYSHVSLAIDSYNIIEADKFIKSRISNLYYIETIHSVYRVKDIDEDERHKVVQNAMTMLGVGYDYKQIFGLYLRMIFHRDSTTFNQANKYICSEIIDNAFIMADIPRKDTNNLGDITPQELFSKYELERVY